MMKLWWTIKTQEDNGPVSVPHAFVFLNKIHSLMYNTALHYMTLSKGPRIVSRTWLWHGRPRILEMDSMQTQSGRPFFLRPRVLRVRVLTHRLLTGTFSHLPVLNVNWYARLWNIIRPRTVRATSVSLTARAQSAQLCRSLNAIHLITSSWWFGMFLMTIPVMHTPSVPKPHKDTHFVSASWSASQWQFTIATLTQFCTKHKWLHSDSSEWPMHPLSNISE